MHKTIEQEVAEAKINLDTASNMPMVIFMLIGVVVIGFVLYQFIGSFGSSDSQQSRKVRDPDQKDGVINLSFNKNQ